MVINFPTILTITRAVLAPLVIVMFYARFDHHYWVAAILFFIAGLTDYLDGFIARRYDLKSNFGAFLDPLADKILVAGVLIMLVEHYRAMWITVPAMIIICRELLVSGLREWMASKGQRHKVSVAFIGKVKTTFQMGSIMGFMLLPIYGWLQWPSKVGIWIATFLTVVSMIMYFYDARRSFDG